MADLPWDLWDPWHPPRFLYIPIRHDNNIVFLLVQWKIRLLYFEHFVQKMFLAGNRTRTPYYEIKQNQPANQLTILMITAKYIIPKLLIIVGPLYSMLQCRINTIIHFHSMVLGGRERESNFTLAQNPNHLFY